MARRCQITGKSPVAGSNISHAHNKTNTRFLPNLQKKRVWVQELNKFVTLKLSASAIKTINKKGTAHIAKMVNENKIKIR